MLRGTVAQFDAEMGLGRVATDDGLDYVFHVVEIADESRTIAVGQPVSFHPLPKFGRMQAGRLHKL